MMWSIGGSLYQKAAAQVEVGMQDAVEDLLYMYQVDLVVSGHSHSYFRSCEGLYAYKCMDGGPVHLIVGTGGAPLDDGPILHNDHTDYFDNTRFGVGRAAVYNATTMHWQFIAVGGDIMDDVWLTRDR